MSIDIRLVCWHPAWRIVPSRYPTVQLFERVAEAADWDAVCALESLTNDRLREEKGELSSLDAEDRLHGPGTRPILAAFTHLNPAGSRFSDGSFGVLYAARTLDTAIAETRHHRSRFLQATHEAPIELSMRVYLIDLNGRLHDLRARQQDFPAEYSTDDYSAGQALGKRLRVEKSLGIAYDSVRHSGGQCAAVFRPRVLAHCRQERHLTYVWDGTKITEVQERSTRWAATMDGI